MGRVTSGPTRAGGRAGLSRVSGASSGAPWSRQPRAAPWPVAFLETCKCFRREKRGREGRSEGVTETELGAVEEREAKAGELETD